MRGATRVVLALLVAGAMVPAVATATGALPTGLIPIEEVPEGSEIVYETSAEAVIGGSNWCSRWYCACLGIWCTCAPLILSPEAYCADCISVRCAANAICIVTDWYCICKCESADLVALTDVKSAMLRYDNIIA